MSRIPYQTLACHKKISPKEKKFVTRVSEGQKVQHSFLFEGGVRVCSDAVLRYFLVQFCGNFYFNPPYCRFKTLSSLQVITTFRLWFSVQKSVYGDDTL